MIEAFAFDIHRFAMRVTVCGFIEQQTEARAEEAARAGKMTRMQEPHCRVERLTPAFFFGNTEQSGRWRTPPLEDIAAAVVAPDLGGSSA